jgi:hypothetical protein
MAHTLDAQALRDWMTPREVVRDGVLIPAEAVPVARRADVLPGVWRWVFKTRVGGTATLGYQDVMYISPRDRVREAFHPPSLLAALWQACSAQHAGRRVSACGRSWRYRRTATRSWCAPRHACAWRCRTF